MIVSRHRIPTFKWSQQGPRLDERIFNTKPLMRPSSAETSYVIGSSAFYNPPEPSRKWANSQNTDGSTS